MRSRTGERAGAASPLRRPGFRALWISRIVSFTGDGAARTALVLVTAERGATAVSLVLLASTLPRLFGPVAGAMADRWERRRLMRACELAQALLIGAIAVAIPPLPVLFVLVLLASGLATVFGPASASSVPELVPATELPRANALIGTAFNFQVALGPVVAGLAIGLGSARLAFAIDAVSFLVSAAVLRGVPKLPLPTGDVGSGSVWSATVEGLRYVRRTPGPRALTLGLATFVAFAGIDNVALVFLVQDQLGGSATSFGLVQAAFGVGMLAASVGLGAWVRPVSSAKLLAAGNGLSITGALATAAVPNFVSAGVAQTLAGSGNGMENVALSTHVQRIVPAAMLGRVFGAVSTAGQVGSGIAYLGAGPLVGVAGPRVAFLIAGIGSALGLILLVPALRQRSAVMPLRSWRR